MVEVRPASLAKALAVLAAQQLCIHVKDEAGSQDIVQIEFIVLDKEYIGVFLVLELRGTRNVELNIFLRLELLAAAVADTEHFRLYRALQAESTGAVYNAALRMRRGNESGHRGKIQPVRFKIAGKRRRRAGHIDYFMKIE